MRKFARLPRTFGGRRRGRKESCLGLIYGGGSMCGDRRQLNMPDVSRCVSHAAADLGSTSEGAQQCSTAPALGERSSSTKLSPPAFRAKLHGSWWISNFLLVALFQAALAHGFRPDLCRLTWMAQRSPSRKPVPWCSEKEGHAALFSKRMRDASARLFRDHAVISVHWSSPLLAD